MTIEKRSRLKRRLRYLRSARRFEQEAKQLAYEANRAGVPSDAYDRLVVDAQRRIGRLRARLGP